MLEGSPMTISSIHVGDLVVSPSLEEPELTPTDDEKSDDDSHLINL